MYTYGKVPIKKNAWIGMNAMICPGVTVGKYAVVAAASSVKMPERIEADYVLLSEEEVEDLEK